MNEKTFAHSFFKFNEFNSKLDVKNKKKEKFYLIAT